MQSFEIVPRDEKPQKGKFKASLFATEEETAFARGPFGQGPRVFAKVVERVTARLEARLAEVGECAAAAALAGKVDKVWREKYGRSLPSEAKVEEEYRKMFLARERARNSRVQNVRARGGANARNVKPTGGAAAPLPNKPKKRRFVLKAADGVSRSAHHRNGTGSSSSSSRGNANTGTKRKRPIGGGGKKAKDAKNSVEAARRRDATEKGTGEGKQDDKQEQQEQQQRLTTAAPDATASLSGATGASFSSPSPSPSLSSPSSAAAAAAAGSGEQGSENKSGNHVVGSEEGGEGVEAERRDDESGGASGGGSVGGGGSGSSVSGEGGKASVEKEEKAEEKEEVEEEEEDTEGPPDVVVTANFVGSLLKTRVRQRWRMEMEGGVIEGNGSVFVFDACECCLVPPG